MKLRSTSWQFALALITTGALSMGAQANDLSPNDVFGPWATHEGGEVKFHPCVEDASDLCGTITALRPEDAVLNPTDANNPDPGLRQRPILGLTMFTGLEADSNGKWSDGELYDTLTGKSYGSKIKLLSLDTLKISGCVGFFCRSFKWQRISAPEELADE